MQLSNLAVKAKSLLSEKLTPVSLQFIKAISEILQFFTLALLILQSWKMQSIKSIPDKSVNVQFVNLYCSKFVSGSGS